MPNVAVKRSEQTLHITVSLQTVQHLFMQKQCGHPSLPGSTQCIQAA